MITITTPPEPLDMVSIDTRYYRYWCSLFTSLGLRLFGLADIAWFLTPISGVDDVISLLRPFEDILNAHIITDGLLVITLGSPRVPYKPSRACNPPSRESYYAWARIASGLAGSLGEELVRRAYTVFLLLKA